MRRIWLALTVALWGAAAIPGYADPVPIGGRIVDSNGRPVGGARVEVGPVPDRFGWSETRLQDKIFPDPVARSASRNDGRFEVKAPGPGMWRVTVTAGGFVPQLYYLTPALDGVELPLLQMSRDVPLRVRVLNPRGQPVAGARIAAGDEMSGTGGFWTTPLQLVITGADGTAQLYRTRRGRIEVEALAAGHPKVETKAEPTQPTVELRLAAACLRPVRVTLQEKKEEPPRPIPGALVTADGWTLGATDADGRLAVSAPCDRELRFEVATRDGRRAEATLPRGPAPAAAAPPFAVPLPALPARISGRVVEDTTRKPVAGALVWPAEDPSAFVLTDAKGAYTIKVPESDNPRVDAAAVGYLPAMEAARGAAGPTLVMKPAATASGTVVDESGKPVADAVVRAAPESGGLRPGRGGANIGLMARSNAQGAFQVRLPPGESVTLTATHPDYTAAKLNLPELAPRSARTGLKLVLARGLSGFGRVVDTAGRPVAGAEVSLSPARPGGDPFASPFPMGDEAAAPPAFTDAQGGFVLDHLEPGRFNLEAKARGFAPVTVPGIQLAEGQPRADLGTVTLAPGAVLEGIVVDPRDRPVAGAWVRVGSRDRFGRRDDDEEPLLTAADGTFAAGDLRPGEKVMLFVSKQGYSRASYNEVEVPPAVPLRVVLKPGMRIAGRVVDEAGEPVSGARVRLSRIATTMVMGGRGLMDRMSGFAASEDDGSFEIDGVEAGKVQLAVNAQGFLEGEIPGFDVVEGRDVEGLEVVLRRGAVIAGRVSGPDGTPVSGARVQIVDDSNNRSMARFLGATSDGDGNYRLEGVPDGAAAFSAQAEGFQRAVRDLEVRAGENRLDFRLEGGHEVSGRVVDAGGQPVSGATVRLGAAGDRFPMLLRGDGQSEARSGADGSFRIAGVSTGSYDVTADKEGYAPGQLESVNVAGRLQGLELRLEAGGAVQGRLLGADLAELAGASVTAFPADPSIARTAVRLARGGQVDYQGQYRISGLTAGEWRVNARTESGRQAQGRVTVSTGSDATLDLDLGGGFTLTGRVVRGGEAVPNVYVSVASSEAGGGRSTTDPQGAFRIQGLKAGTYELQAMQFDSGLDHQETVEVTGDRDILIEIATRRVSGRVVDATDQAPVPGVVVSLEATETQTDRPRFGMGRGSRSDADGAFTITDVSPGSYRLVARMEGYAPAETTVQVSNADDVDGVRLAIQPTQGLTLEVRTALGSPPPEVRVALLDASGRTVVSGVHSTGENGRVRVSSAPPGSWRLLASSAGSATTTQDVQVPGPAVPVILTAGATLAVLAEGLPAGSRVTVTGSDGQPFRSLLYSVVLADWPLTNGRAMIEGLPAGQWRLRATSPDGQAREGTASVSPGGASQVVLR